ncbi:DNA-directed RNA polymerase subunit delta [Metamycoplasma equirhinis]|uniref:DNA-directed RNA polymerase subunit delta n=1 Tax=Metamycoplasma equirhinis TaxID=92402 RepID=UPI00359382BF
MRYKTLVDVAKEILDTKEAMNFQDIFANVKSQLFDRWRAETSNNVSDDELLEKKRGELYRLLTIDGRFFHKENGEWTSIRPDKLS